MSILDTIGHIFAQPQQASPQAPLQFGLPQNIPSAGGAAPPQQQGQNQQGQMPQGTLDAIMNLFGGAGGAAGAGSFIGMM